MTLPQKQALKACKSHGWQYGARAGVWPAVGSQVTSPAADPSGQVTGANCSQTFKWTA